jgi:hypothetical protein
VRKKIFRHFSENEINGNNNIWIFIQKGFNIWNFIRLFIVDFYRFQLNIMWNLVVVVTTFRLFNLLVVVYSYVIYHVSFYFASLILLVGYIVSGTSDSIPIFFHLLPFDIVWWLVEHQSVVFLSIRIMWCLDKKKIFKFPFFKSRLSVFINTISFLIKQKDLEEKNFRPQPQTKKKQMTIWKKKNKGGWKIK